ncbi:unnamed protein product [Lymnaea stagnalis]|uniref:Nidogen n=1 Tax=Lymnaea stagnalis TaxID=6523 RepID=A0AAV2H9L8_LYMST
MASLSSAPTFRHFAVCLVLSCAVVRVTSLSLDLFYPFGAHVGDDTVDPGDDASSSEIKLPEPIIFYNSSFRNIYVNINGHVSFETDVPSYRADLAMPLGFHIIAVFLADVDTTTSGRVYYRATADKALLQRAAADIQTYFSGFESFIPTALFIVTWDRVGSYSQQSDKLNTFQLVLMTDGIHSFALFHYLDGGIQWTKSQGKFEPTYSDIPPQAGFEGGRGGSFYTLPGSADSGAFVTGSNVNFPGVWMYHIGNTRNGNVRPADLNTGEVTLFDVETPQDGCVQSAYTCHQNAQCIDNDVGSCCACVPPFYGNGLACLEPGVAQKLNGRVYGNLNGITLDNDLNIHTYVVITDGRTYSAISRVPEILGPALETLNSIGGIIGWLFAVPMNPHAKNGYSLTGGKFNRTARVTFQSVDRADYVVRIYQVFNGHDSPNNIRMETRLEGNVPEIPLGAMVSVDDYNENYKKTSRGTVKAFVERTYRVNDVAYRYTWDNTITFDECDDGKTLASDVLRLTVNRHFVKHSQQDQVVRFAMTSKVGLFTGADPCAISANKCGENADCVPLGETHKCVCRTGYSGDGMKCEDINECLLNPCHQNARCFNLPGSFQCRCQPGFSGDGRTCRADVPLCGQVVCDSNAQCAFTEGTRQPQCVCNTGFRGDGVTCAPFTATCNEAPICAENAQCVYDDELRTYSCECLDEFSGDGYSCQPLLDNGCGECHRFGQCIFNIERKTYGCQCNPGYTGDGKRCSLIDTCADCDRNARCTFNDDISDYECTCLRGYRGDGKRCQLRDCREDSQMCDPVGGICWLDKDRNVSICRCNYGYRGDGFNCQPIGCDVYNDCHENARCISNGTKHFCQCIDGFEGDGKRCRPLTIGCNVRNDCDQNARCGPDAADPSVFTCRCNPGYSGDGKLCTRRMVPCNQVNNCDRNAECVYDPDLMSYACRCTRGYEGDGIACRRKDIFDCRRNQNMCAREAECVQGADEAYVCVCKSGFRGDGAVCSPFMLSSCHLLSRLFVRGTTLFTKDYGQQLINIRNMLAVGVDTDCQDGYLYWTDASMGLIRRSKLNGSDVEVIVSGLKSPEGIAVDFSARNIFFTDSELDTLQVTRLDGSHLKTLVSTDMVNPRAIVLDINRGVIYWTDWNRNRPQIEKINMDGTDRKVLVSDGLQLPNGLSFDPFSQTLCWGDAGTQSIECIRSDGAGRRVVYAKATYPFDITVLNNIIYWTDWQRKDVPNINQSGGEVNEPLQQAIGGNGRLYGITAVKDQCPRARNSCGLNDGGCKFLCLASQNRGRTCACPDGMDPRLCQQ